MTQYLDDHIGCVMLLSFIKLAVGLTILLYSSSKAIDAAATIAKRFHISELVIGLTIVALGTSLPEIVISAQAAIKGSIGVGLGNAIGSNIANIAIILGSILLFYQVPVSRGVRFRAVWLMLLFNAMCLAALIFLGFGWATFGIMAAVMILFMIDIIWHKKDGDMPAEWQAETHIERASISKEFIILILAFVFIYFSSEYTIMGATEIARGLGVSELVIGLTIVAIGTSLPELVTSGIAARGGKPELAIGNIIGSNIFNLSAVLMAPAALLRMPVAGQVVNRDIPVYLALALGFAAFTYFNEKLSRRHGFVFLLIYAYYMAMIFLVG